MTVLSIWAMRSITVSIMVPMSLRGKQHINGIESFWSYTKGRLAKFHGISKEMFYLHLKETEFRFNHKHEDLGKILMKMLRNNPI